MMSSPPRVTRCASRSELEIRHAIGELGALRVLPAGQRFHPGQTFREGIGLGQVIIATGAQAEHAVIHLAEGGQNKNRCRAFFGRSDVISDRPSRLGSMRSTISTS